MRTFTDGALSVTCFDAQVYAQEHNVLQITNESLGLVRYVTIQIGGLGLRYDMGTETRTDINVSEFLRAYQSAGNIRVQNDDGDEVNIPFSVVGLLNPYSLRMPKTDTAEIIEELGGVRAAIYSPSKVLQNLNAACLTRVEFYPSADELERYTIELPVVGWVDVQRSQELPNRLAVINTAIEQESVQRVQVEPLSCEREYVCVEWASGTGVTRRHTMEYRNAKSSVFDEVNFETQNGQYRLARGRENGGVIYLDGLDAYDFAYYGDMIFSQSVRVTFDGITWYNVRVDASELQTPNTSAGAFNKLELPFNYIRYANPL